MVKYCMFGCLPNEMWLAIPKNVNIWGKRAIKIFFF